MDHEDRKTVGDRIRILWTGDVRGDRMHIVAIDNGEAVEYAAHRYCEGCGGWHSDSDVPAADVITALIAAGKLKL